MLLDIDEKTLETSLKNFCEGLLSISKREDVQIIYPVHLNPNVKNTVYNILSDNSNILLLEPLDYEAFIWLLKESYLIITDSGGVQEEAPSLGNPVLVTRDVTERQEAVETGTVKLVGTDKEKIIHETNILLDNEIIYKDMSSKKKSLRRWEIFKKNIRYYFKCFVVMKSLVIIEEIGDISVSASIVNWSLLEVLNKRFNYLDVLNSGQYI